MDDLKAAFLRFRLVGAISPLAWVVGDLPTPPFGSFPLIKRLPYDAHSGEF
jgi:hypothetical protein